MAYSDYGAFVWRNGERRTDKEDAPLFASSEETFGADIDRIPSAARIWASLIHAQSSDREINWLTSIHHGILGDGPVRVLCHKQGLPEIWEMTDDRPKKIPYYDDETTDYADFEPFDFEYKGYRFHFESGEPYRVTMTEPDGAEWECEYDYGYGAGFEEES